jgi:hypothetical protein
VHKGLQATVRLVLQELREFSDRSLTTDCFVILGVLMLCPMFTPQPFFIQHFAPQEKFSAQNPDPHQSQSFESFDVGPELFSNVDRSFRAICTLFELGFIRLLQVKSDKEGSYCYVMCMPRLIKSTLSSFGVHALAMAAVVLDCTRSYMTIQIESIEDLQYNHQTSLIF